MDYQEILMQIQTDIQPLFGKGQVANYIPALAQIPPSKFGMAVCTNNGEEFSCGDCDEPFSLQSISKLFVFIMAMNSSQPDPWDRVGKEPSGNPFNSLLQLEYERGKPRNPFINAGALVITDYLMQIYPAAKSDILNFIRGLAGNQQIDFNRVVAESEKACGHRNAALANLMKSFGNLFQPVEDVLDTYCYHCSIEMTCRDLVRSCRFLINQGVNPLDNRKILTNSKIKRINAMMLTCGLYDRVGEFAYLVGLPAKSGVGGGIIAILPRKLAIAVWSPELDPSGNSLIGTKALELFTTYTKKSIF